MRLIAYILNQFSENTNTKSREDQITSEKSKGTKVVLGSSYTNQKGKIEQFLQKRAKKAASLSKLAQNVKIAKITKIEHPFVMDRQNSVIFCDSNFKNS